MAPVYRPGLARMPWIVSAPMRKIEGPIYEYACHEGNYALRNILSGARTQELKAAASKGTKGNQ